jgi:hypothetical protein
MAWNRPGRPAPAWHGQRAARRQSLLLALAAGATFAVAIGVIVIALRPGAGPASPTVPEPLSTSVPRQVVTSPLPLAPSQPVGIMIPSIGVDAPLMSLAENANGSMRVPPVTNHNLAGWYSKGPAPGQRGPAVILGLAVASGVKSVFFAIGTLSPGARISISLADGHVAVFAVDGVQRVATARFPTTAVYGPLLYPALRLITSAGSDSIIVYAHPAS